MRLRWKDVEDICQGFLKDDPVQGRPVRYEGDTLRQWWNLAQNRLISLVPFEDHVIYKDEPAPLRLPPLFYQPRVLHLPDLSAPIERIRVEQALVSKLSGYYLHQGKIYFANLNISTVETAILIYNAYLPKVENDESEVRTPDWAIEACVIYVAMEAATREAMGDARYRKFAQPTDAGGNPTHNPFVHMAKFLEERFNAIVATHSTDDQPMNED